VKPQNRRTFIATIGAAAVSLAGGCNAAPPRRRKLDRIGLQLYTVRNQMKEDLPGTIASVAAVGYKEVEFAGYFGRSPTEIRDLLARNALTSPSTHFPIEGMRKEWPKMLDEARQIGHQWVTIPWLPENDRGNLDGWKRLAAEFNGAARMARDKGLRFAYHNHDFELKGIPATAGQTNTSTIPLDVLIADTDPSLVDFELDLYWVVKGGADPSSYFTRFPNRFPMVHVKDSAGPPAHTMTDVGRGSIDFRRIFADGEKGGIKHFFVEHDEPADPMASIRTSYNHLRALEY
jgi:sugar phosphate isomerase/epimerase